MLELYGTMFYIFCSGFKNRLLTSEIFYFFYNLLSRRALFTVLAVLDDVFRLCEDTEENNFLVILFEKLKVFDLLELIDSIKGRCSMF